MTVRYWTTILFALVVVGTLTSSSGLSEDGNAMLEFDRCNAIVDNTIRLECLKKLILPAPQSMPSLLNAWKLIRTPDPRGGADTISILQVADLSRSSPDFAGLIIRCQKGGTPEFLIALVKPISPRAHPKVTIDTAENEIVFDATVVPPGSAILLPPEVQNLANGPWERLTELAVKIEDSEVSAQGVVPIGGLDGALIKLNSSCDAP